MMVETHQNFKVITTVCAIITRQDADQVRVLLTLRGYPPFQGQWCLPGGHIEKNETAQQAVIREIKEEVGLGFNAVFNFYWDEIIPEMDIHAVVLVFTGPVEGELMAQPGEVVEIKWFALEEIESIPLAFQHNGILKKFFKRE
jgi:8-oxo-dGTP diphosphatase